MPARRYNNIKRGVKPHMSNLIDTVEAALAEIEEQMLAEFSRIRNTVSEHRFSPMDAGIKNALLEVLGLVHGNLESSGDIANLQLLTTQQENLFTRIVIIRQLLNAHIPTAFLHSAHDNIETSRQRIEKRARALKQRAAASITITNIDAGKDKTTARESGGLLRLVKGIFRRKPTDPDFKGKRLYITDQEAKILVDQEVYLDTGMYSAARELAMLASMIAEDTDQSDSSPKPASAPSLPTGKAIFEAKNVSSTITPLENIQPVKQKPEELARSPEAIRQKLAARQAHVEAGKANFGSRDIEALSDRAMPKIPAAASTSKASFISRDTKTTNHQNLVTPAVRKAAPVTTGRATFASRDIEPVVPQQPPQRRIPRPTPESTPEPPKPTGKAVFESRDVGQQPTKQR
jgi:hypothetical protein